jgi:hypothetical protein
MKVSLFVVCGELRPIILKRYIQIMLISLCESNFFFILVSTAHHLRAKVPIKKLKIIANFFR